VVSIIFSFRKDRLKDLRQEGEITKGVPPDQRLRIAFEFLEFSESLYKAGNKNKGEVFDED